jgi:hypothetical protein
VEPKPPLVIFVGGYFNPDVDLPSLGQPVAEGSVPLGQDGLHIEYRTSQSFEVVSSGHAPMNDGVMFDGRPLGAVPPFGMKNVDSYLLFRAQSVRNENDFAEFRIARLRNTGTLKKTSGQQQQQQQHM